MNIMLRHSGSRFLLLALWLLPLCLVGRQEAGADVGRSEGADLVFGGAGTDEGQFTTLRDITFDSQNNLYVLESNGPLRVNNAQSVEGQARVQKFDSSGRFLDSFSLGDDLPVPIKGGGPTRLAVDSQGNVAVTLPQQDLLRLFDARGRKVRDVPLPGAQAVTVTQTPEGERFAVVSWKTQRANRQNVQTGGDFVQLVDATSGNARPVNLSERVENATDIAAAPDGSLWILGDRRIVGFGANGEKIRAIGSGLNRLAEDGSEPRSSITTDSKGNIYAPVGGNPPLIARYSADGQQLALQKGQFKYADPWAYGGTQLPLAVDRTDRLWAASTFYRNAQIAPKSHFSPALIRTSTSFYQAGVSGVKTVDARTLGLSASIETRAPYRISYDLSPVPCEFVVAPSNRSVKSLNVRWNVYDWRQNSVGEGQFALPTRDGQEARAAFSWTPPRYGWYTARAQMFDGNDSLTSIVGYFGVTPRYPQMVALQGGDAFGGMEDAPKQLFAGLPMIRLQVPDRTDQATLDKWMGDIACNKALEAQGLNIVVQLADDKANFTVEKLRPALERLRGRVRYIELFNEPNFPFKPDQYVAAAKPVYDLVKQTDPNFRVLGPSVVAMSLGWHDAFFKAGGGDTYDEFAFHDYEGHESIMPEHWQWKMAQLHTMMQRYGVDNRPMWQTERAISGVRAGSFLPLTQAVRLSLHNDVLQSLGVPPERNMHYYMNIAGYSKVPTYLWTPQGPFPGIMAMRTRYAMTQGLNYAGTLNFGDTGNEIFMGLRFQNPNGQDAVVSLRNLGDLDRGAEFTVAGSPRLRLVDSWGNQSEVTAQNGRATIVLGQLPTFVRLEPGQRITPVRYELGRNIAPGAQLALVTGQEQKNKPPSLLTNGIIEDEHADSPTRGKTWDGGPLASGTPTTIQMRWPSPRPISAVLLRGPRGDNAFCALLDYDIQVMQGGQWRTIVQSRTPLPQSFGAKMADANSVQWYLDDNLRLAQFDTVTTDRLRIVARRSTYGYNADEAGYKLNFASRSKPVEARFQLKEIEVFGP